MPELNTQHVQMYVLEKLSKNRYIDLDYLYIYVHSLVYLHVSRYSCIILQVITLTTIFSDRF